MDRLLVIDDELGFGEIIGKVGRSLGFEVAVTDQADVFREQLDAFQPSVVSVDLMMPGIDGIELLRELAAGGCKADILVTSGVDARTLNTAGYLGRELGLNIKRVIPKPIRVADLRAILEGVKKQSFVVTKDAIEEAIRDDHLFLVYQPKFNFKSRQIDGAEALVRWRRPDGSVIPPDAFVPFAEKSDLADPLTNWVLRRALAQAAAWRKTGPGLRMAVNISALNLHDLTLPDWIERACANVGVPPSEITLEMTETAMMSEASRMLDILARFRVKGFNLSIDDFGTGYSSLVQLHRLPFSEIKIDRSLVMSMHESSDAQVIVRAITDLGHNLGLAVVAEGVENAAALKLLAERNCDDAQGYFISRPCSGEDVSGFASRWSPPSLT